MVTDPSSSTPALSHFWIRRMMRRSPTRCSRKRISHSWLTVSKKLFRSASMIQLTPFVSRIPTIRASSASCWLRPGRKTVREPEEVFLIDLVQYGGGCSLDDLVLERRHGEWPLPSIGFRYIPTPGWLRPVRSPMDLGI